MPLYTFRCRKCGETTEVVHSFCEPHPTTCEKVAAKAVYTTENIRLEGAKWQVISTRPNFKLSLCGGPLERIFNAPSIHYHGSGFYSTDKLLTPVKPEDYNAMED